MIKRPGVDQFMKRVGELYEVVIFTASVAKVRLLWCTCCIAADGASMGIPCWTSWTFTMPSTIGYSETVVSTIKETMSRLVYYGRSRCLPD